MSLREPLLQAVLNGPDSAFWNFASGIMVRQILEPIPNAPDQAALFCSGTAFSPNRVQLQPAAQVK